MCRSGPERSFVGMDQITKPRSELKARHAAMWASGDYPSMVETFLLRWAPAWWTRATSAPGLRVLDVAAGTGNASLPAAATGAHVVASDLTPELLVAGRARAEAAGLSLERVEADAEDLPFEDESFDVVISAIGAMFAPHHQLVADELVRVCRPGGKIALLSWTPEGTIGQLFKTMGPYAPPPPPGAPPPPLWGSEGHLRELFGERVELSIAPARDARGHGLRAAARLRRALQGPLRPDDRHPRQRGEERSSKRSTPRSTSSATTGTSARTAARGSSSSTCWRSAPAPDPLTSSGTCSTSTCRSSSAFSRRGSAIAWSRSGRSGPARSAAATRRRATSTCRRSSAPLSRPELEALAAEPVGGAVSGARAGVRAVRGPSRVPAQPQHRPRDGAPRGLRPGRRAAVLVRARPRDRSRARRAAASGRTRANSSASCRCGEALRESLAWWREYGGPQARWPRPGRWAWLETGRWLSKREAAAG